jgi:hypothetical protein
MAQAQPLTSKDRFLILVGAAAPEVVRWYRIALRPSESDLPASWPLYLAVLTSPLVLPR